MLAQKHTVSVVVEVLDLASVPAMLQTVAEQLRAEANTGMLQMTDGDRVSWTDKQEPVTF